MFKKLKKGLLAGTIFSAAANLNACVYGPPPNSSAIVPEKNTITTTQPEQTEEFDPSDNQNADVYGPPEMFNTEPDEPEVTEEFDPDDNMNAAVYGPPEMFGIETEEE